MLQAVHTGITRRHLQVALGLLWLLDGALQCQPYMFSRGFANDVISGAGEGQAQPVTSLVDWAARLVAQHPVAWNLPFALAQILIGLGLLFRRSARVALAASIAWAAGVWLFGEGLGGLTSGDATLLTGWPGAVLLYAVLAAAVWPRADGSDSAPASWLPLAWVGLWVSGALLQALPSNHSSDALAGAISGSSDGAPHWLASLETTLGRWTSHGGAAVVAALIVVEVAIGIAVLTPRARPAAAVTGAMLALVIWLTAQSLGELYSGQSTDPNSGPLIVLMALALLPSLQPRSWFPQPSRQVTPQRPLAA